MSVKTEKWQGTEWLVIFSASDLPITAAETRLVRSLVAAKQREFPHGFRVFVCPNKETADRLAAIWAD